MRVLLRPVLVPELGLVIVKPGSESMPVFHNTRVLVEPAVQNLREINCAVLGDADGAEASVCEEPAGRSCRSPAAGGG